MLIDCVSEGTRNSFSHPTANVDSQVPWRHFKENYQKLVSCSTIIDGNYSPQILTLVTTHCFEKVSTYWKFISAIKLFLFLGEKKNIEWAWSWSCKTFVVCLWIACIETNFEVEKHLIIDLCNCRYSCLWWNS